MALGRAQVRAAGLTCMKRARQPASVTTSDLLQSAPVSEQQEIPPDPVAGIAVPREARHSGGAYGPWQISGRPWPRPSRIRGTCSGHGTSFSSARPGSSTRRSGIRSPCGPPCSRRCMKRPPCLSEAVSAQRRELRLPGFPCGRCLLRPFRRSPAIQEARPRRMRYLIRWGGLPPPPDGISNGVYWKLI